MERVSLDQEVAKLKQDLEKLNMKTTAQGAIFNDVSQKYIKLKESYKELSQREERCEAGGKTRDDLNEEIKNLKGKLDEKIEENTTLQSLLDAEKEVSQENMRNYEDQKARADQNQEIIRDFSQVRGKKVNYEETFESVLRNEFHQMRSNLEEQISKLKAQLSDERRQHLIERADKTKVIEELRVTKQTLSTRLMTMRQKEQERIEKEEKQIQEMISSGQV